MKIKIKLILIFAFSLGILSSINVFSNNNLYALSLSNSSQSSSSPSISNTSNASNTSSPSPPIISTRGDFNMMTGKLNPGVNSTSYKLTGSPVPGLNNNLHCPNTTIIFVHGWATNPQQAIDNYNDIAPTLSSKGFVTIFSWDSNNFPPKDKSISIMNAGNTAENIADQNSLKLGQFIFDYANACPQMDIRLMTHSLGNRVVLQTLNILDQYRIAFPDRWHTLITSVDLMAAGVPASSVSNTGEFHNGLKMAADIHNYYSGKDPILNILELIENLTSNNPALGHTSAPTSSIYSINVTDIIGEDHHAYLSPSFMKLVMNNWNHQNIFKNNSSLNFDPRSFCYPGLQECSKEKNMGLSLKNGASICNPSFDKCSQSAVLKDNVNYTDNREKKAAAVESSIGSANLTNLSHLIDQVFSGNSTAVPDLFSLFAKLHYK